MKLSIDRAALAGAMALCRQVFVETNSAPTLAAVMLSAEGSAVTLRAVGVDQRLRVTTPASVEEAGRALVSGARLAAVAREAPEGALALASHGEHGVSIRARGASWRLPGIPPDEFPAYEPPAEGPGTTFQAALLATGLRRTSFAALKDKTGNALTGVLLEAHGGGIRLTATDRHRAIRLTVPADVGAEALPAEGVVFPIDGLRTLLGLLQAHDDEPAILRLSPTDLSVSVGGAAWSTRRLEGQYLAVQRIYDHAAKLPELVEVDAGDLEAVVRRASLLGEADKPIVAGQIQGAVLTLANLDKAGGDGVIECQVKRSSEDAPDVSLSFNARYVLDFLAATEATGSLLLRLGLNGFTDPLFFAGDAAPEYIVAQIRT